MSKLTTTEIRLDQPGLIPRKAQPENLESPINTLYSWQTPNELFYLRNHLPYPSIDMSNWFLSIGGEVGQSKSFSYVDLCLMPQVSKFVTLECSGNKRGLMEPLTEGEQWNIGAIGNAKWTGVPLSFLLDQLGVKACAKEIVFSGSDRGPRPDLPGDYNFERSLPYNTKLIDECLIALQMNDEPIPFKHGYPARLIVPGWYGMAHVKWLNRISVINDTFQGPFQVVDYVYITNEDDFSSATPVQEMKVNSIITWPSHGEALKLGVHKLKGLAWAGKFTIKEVEISTDQGASWSKAQLTSSQHAPYTWTFWELDWAANSPGHHSIMVRARDSANNLQPKQAPWNAKGYANNSIHCVQITVPATPKVKLH